MLFWHWLVHSCWWYAVVHFSSFVNLLLILLKKLWGISSFVSLYVLSGSCTLMLCWFQHYLLADSTMALTQAFMVWKNVWLKNFGRFPVSSVCPILTEKFRGSGCLKFSIVCLDSLRQCAPHGYPDGRPPVAPCSPRVKLQVLQQRNPLLSYQSLAAFLGSSKYFLSTEEK